VMMKFYHVTNRFKIEFLLNCLQRSDDNSENIFSKLTFQITRAQPAQQSRQTQILLFVYIHFRTKFQSSDSTIEGYVGREYKHHILLFSNIEARI
jgi:hypothetical protein